MRRWHLGLLAVAVVAVAFAVGAALVGESGPAAGCTLADATGCSAVAGRTLTIDDPVDGHGQGAEYLSCDGSLLSLQHEDGVVTGSGWPVKVHISFPPGRVLREDKFGFGISPGCEGDGDPDTIDLVLEIEGDGLTRGFADDPVKVKSTVDPPGGLQVTGSVDCGPQVDRAHQDGIQVQGGTGIGFYDVEIGDWEAGRATCAGAGGAFFISGTRSTWGTDITVERMHAVACNHALGINPDTPSTGTMTDSGFRAGNPADSAAGKCEFQSRVCADFDRAPRWTFTNVDCDEWPYAGQRR